MPGLNLVPCAIKSCGLGVCTLFGSKFHDLGYKPVWDRLIDRKLDGSPSCFIPRKLFLESQISGRQGIETDMLFEGGKIHEWALVQFVGRHVVVDTFDGLGGDFLYDGADLL